MPKKKINYGKLIPKDGAPKFNFLDGEMPERFEKILQGKPSEQAQTPMENMIQGGTLKEQKEAKTVRTTICVYPEDYRKFKAYAATRGTTVTALINDFIKATLENDKY